MVEHNGDWILWPYLVSAIFYLKRFKAGFLEHESGCMIIWVSSCLVWRLKLLRIFLLNQNIFCPMKLFLPPKTLLFLQVQIHFFVVFVLLYGHNPKSERSAKVDGWRNLCKIQWNFEFHELPTIRNREVTRKGSSEQLRLNCWIQGLFLFIL